MVHSDRTVGNPDRRFFVVAQELRHILGDIFEICHNDYARNATAGRAIAADPERKLLRLDRPVFLPKEGHA